MNVNEPRFDAVFMEKQRRYLIEQRAALLAIAQSDEDEETEVKRESAGQPREYEDDAQKLANLELEGNLVVRNLQRLAIIERALTKLDEGTYGVSDVSGQPIPRDRLRAVPEAICTLEEEDEVQRRMSG